MSHPVAPLPSLASVSWPVNVGQAARLAGLSPKMVRYYESRGLLGDIARSEGGYRLYGQSEVQALCFIRRSRAVGFDMEQTASLLDLWRNPTRSSAQVKALAQAQVERLERRIADLQAMQATLETLVHACHGDQRPECAILDSLGSAQEPACCEGGRM